MEPSPQPLSRELIPFIFHILSAGEGTEEKHMNRGLFFSIAHTPRLILRPEILPQIIWLIQIEHFLARLPCTTSKNILTSCVLELYCL